MLSAFRRYGVSHALRASAPRSLSARLTPQVLKWQPQSTPAFPALSRSLQTSIPALSSASATAEQPKESESSVPERITEFLDLRKHGLIDAAVINNIAHPNRMNITTMTDVQSLTLNEVLGGGDVLAQAKTGTGKTLAFLVPAIQNILNDPTLKNAKLSRDADASDIRAIIISPTRELAEQIAVEAKKVTAHTGLKVQTAVGGTQKALGLQRIRREGCHLLIGTPGRLQDILSNPSTGVSTPKLNTLILDEADRLLDDGFAPAIMDIEQLLPDPRKVDRQTLMFSATVPKGVMSMVRRMMKPDFKFVKTVRDDEIPTHLYVPQRKVMLKGYENALPAVLELAKEYKARAAGSDLRPFKAIVYFNTTAMVKLAAEAFRFLREIRTVELHSRLNQQQRTRNADLFRRSPEAILFSSDVTARGMDFPDVTHVIQIGIPKEKETYIHRLGRTARANKTGEGWILCHPDEDESFDEMLRDLPIKEDTSLSAARVDMGQNDLVDADPNNAANIERLRSAMSRVSDDTKADAYRTHLTSLKGTFVSNRRMVKAVNDQALRGWNMVELPMISPNTVRNLGLDRIPGLNIGHPRQTVKDFIPRIPERRRHNDFNRRGRTNDERTRHSRPDFSRGRGRSWDADDMY